MPLFPLLTLSCDILVGKSYYLLSPHKNFKRRAVGMRYDAGGIIVASQRIIVVFIISSSPQVSNMFRPTVLRTMYYDQLACESESVSLGHRFLGPRATQPKGPGLKSHHISPQALYLVALPGKKRHDCRLERRRMGLHLTVHSTDSSHKRRSRARFQ